MKRHLHTVLTSGALVLATAAVGRPQAQPGPAPNEVQIGPITASPVANGVGLNVPVTTFVAVMTTPAGITLDSRVYADLLDVQNKIGSIIDTIPLPTNNCASFSGNNPVVRIWGKQLVASGASAVLKLNGYVEMWDCRENPIPNSKIDWVEERWLGVPVKRPKVVTWPGDPIKNKLATQPFDASLTITPHLVNDQTAAVRLENPQISLGGQYAVITNGILRVAGIDLNGEAGKALSNALDPALLQQSMPKDLADLNPKIKKAEFTDVGGRLGLSVGAAAQLPADRLTDLLKALVEKPRTD